MNRFKSMDNQCKLIRFGQKLEIMAINLREVVFFISGSLQFQVV